MALTATGTKRTARQKIATKPASAADRILTPSVKPTNGITRAQIRKAIREVRAEREAKERQAHQG